MPPAETYPQAMPQFDRREAIWSVNERWRWRTLNEDLLDGRRLRR